MNIFNLMIYFNNNYFLNNDSRILFIEIVNILKKTKNKPNHPKIIAIDSKLEPKSRFSKFCIYPLFNGYNSTLKIYFFLNKKCKFYDFL